MTLPLDEHNAQMHLKTLRRALMADNNLLIAYAQSGRDLFETYQWHPYKGTPLDVYTVVHWKWSNDIGWYPFLVNGRRCGYDGEPTDNPPPVL